MRKKSKSETNEFTLWWSDDTHWNKNGMAIAVDQIMKELKCFSN